MSIIKPSFNKWWALLFFVGSGLIVAWPWFFQEGYLFLLDFVWPPELIPPTDYLSKGFISSMPFEWLWWILSRLMSVSFLQKLAFVSPYVLAGWSMFCLFSFLSKQYWKSETILVSLTVGLFYALNPYIFTRSVMGQHYFLLAYALTPFVIFALFRWFTEPSKKTAFVVGLVAVAVMLTNAHHVIIVPMILIPLLFVIRPKKGFSSYPLLIWLPVIVFFVIAFSVYVFSFSPVEAFSELGPWARATKAPQTGSLLIDTLTLTANWKTDLPFMFPYQTLRGFIVVEAILMTLMGAGIYALWNKRESRVLFFALGGVSVISVVLTIGVAYPATEWLSRWLYQNVPFWLGMRDATKFLSILALTESIIFGFGINAVIAWIRHTSNNAFLGFVARALVFILMIYFVSPSFLGFGGQVAANNYPSSWYEWRGEMKKKEKKPKILVLPWHMYLPTSFTNDRTVVNPAPRFFSSAEIISGDNSEVGGINGTPFVYSESDRPISKVIEKLLKGKEQLTNLGQELTEQDINYVMLIKDTRDVNEYNFLYDQEDLTNVFEKEDLVVWSVK